MQFDWDLTLNILAAGAVVYIAYRLFKPAPPAPPPKKPRANPPPRDFTLEVS